MTKGSNITLAGGTAAPVKMNGSLAASLVALLLALLVMLTGLTTIISTVFMTTGEANAGKVVATHLDRHNQAMQKYQERFNGRSIFFKPPPKPVERRPEPQGPEIVTPPPPPPTPTGPDPLYKGPSIAFAFTDQVWFQPTSASGADKYLKVKVGEMNQGVKVISTEKLPWTVRVGYGGGEYDVKVFGDQDTTPFFAAKATVPVLPGFLEIPPAAPPPSSTQPSATEPPPTIATTPSRTVLDREARRAERDARRKAREATGEGGPDEQGTSPTQATPEEEAGESPEGDDDEQLEEGPPGDDPQDPQDPKTEPAPEPGEEEEPAPPPDDTEEPAPQQPPAPPPPPPAPGASKIAAFACSSGNALPPAASVVSG